MNASVIFDAMNRTDRHPRRHDESSWQFLNRIAGEYWDRVRSLCEIWLREMPSEVQADVRARLRSPSQLQTNGAFWEMYLHTAFRRLGFSMKPHPDVPGSSNHPDFKILEPGKPFYLEATCSASSDAVAAESARAEVVYAALDRLSNKDFWLQVEIRQQGRESLPARNLRTRIERLLESADVNQLHRTLETGEASMDDLPTLTWVEGDWEVEVRALPKPPKARGSDEIRPVGVMGPTVGWTDDRASLVRTLERKARRYGTLDAPYLLAVRLDGLTADSNDIFDALFGSRAVRVGKSNSGEYQAVPFRNSDGFWMGPNGARARRVSGVLFAYDVQPALVCRESTAPFLWLNPWAERPLPELTVRTTFIDLETGKPQTRGSSRAQHEVFGLDARWPGEDATRFAS